MNGFAENMASNASGKPGGTGTVLTLTTSCQMLSLVRGIIRDVVEAQERLSRMGPELQVLDRERRALTWPSRSRRYLLKEEIALEERRLEACALGARGIGSHGPRCSSRPRWLSNHCQPAGGVFYLADRGRSAGVLAICGRCHQAKDPCEMVGGAERDTRRKGLTVTYSHRA